VTVQSGIVTAESGTVTVQSGTQSKSVTFNRTKRSCSPDRLVKSGTQSKSVTFNRTKRSCSPDRLVTFNRIRRSRSAGLRTFAQPGTITLVIDYIDAEKHRGAEVSLKFSGVTEIELSELRSENVIDALRIPEVFPAQVTLEACYGLEGSFRCAAVEVSSVMPNPSFESDAQKAARPSS